MNNIDVDQIRLLIVIGLIVFLMMSYIERRRRNSIYKKHLDEVQKIMNSSGDQHDRSLELQKEMVAKLGDIKSLLEKRGV
jgi:hypothetical protein